MAVIAGSAVARASRFARRWLAALCVIGLAAAGAFALYVGAGDLSKRAGLSGTSLLAAAISEKVQQGVNKVKSVADMLAGRSPGQRARGTLANLKHKRHPRALHARALPKTKKALPAAASPLASIIAPPAETVPPAPAVLPPTAPVFSAVTAAPPATQVAEAKPPIVFPPILPLPGSGYNIPPFGGPQGSEGGPGAAVPEPASWLFMLVGFGLIGGMVRRGRKVAHA